jgi:hypothetical protein
VVRRHFPWHNSAQLPDFGVFLHYSIVGFKLKKTHYKAWAINMLLLDIPKKNNGNTWVSVRSNMIYKWWIGEILF